MYIKELRIDGFGALSGESCRLDAPLTVVFGPNEAGKSTLLRFVRTMLYGFANRGQPAERGEPVRGGRHGGRIVLLADDGREWAFERYADLPSRRGGAGVVVRDEDGNEWPMTQAELERKLLGGVSEKLFRQLFAVTLDELQELRSLQGEEVGNYLYHAGMAGGAALTSAGRTITAELDRLFKPRGEQPDLNRALTAVREREAKLREVRRDADLYNETAAELARIETELEEADIRLPELRRRLASVQAAVGARQTWLRLREIELEEAEWVSRLSRPEAEPVEEEAQARWEALAADRERAAERLRQTEEELSRLQEERSGLRWDEPLLEALADVDRLEAQREAAVARREELAELSADLRLQEETLAALLGRLSPGWEEAELQSFASLSERERARAMQSAMAELQRELERLNADIRRMERQRAVQAESEREAAAPGRMIEENEGTFGNSKERENAVDTAYLFGEFVPPDKRALLQAWQETEDERLSWERAWLAAVYAGAANGEGAWPGAGLTQEEERHAGPDEPWRQRGRNSDRGRAATRDRLEAGGSRASGMKPGGRRKSDRAPDRRRAWALAAAGLAAASALLAALGGTGGGDAAAAAYAAAALLFAAAVWLFARRSDVPVPSAYDPLAEERASEAAAELARRERKLEAALHRLLRHPETFIVRLREDAAAGDRTAEAGWKALREAVYARAEQFDRHERERAARHEQERLRAEWRRERERLEEERGAAAEAAERLRRQWEGWLAERKLPAGLAPELLPELFPLAEQALQTLRQRGRLAVRAAQLTASSAAFEAAAADLLAAFPPPPEASGDAALAVKLLHVRARRERETAAEARRLDARLREAEAARNAALAAASRAAQAIAGALDAAGEPDEAAYERRLRVDARRRALARERREAQLRLAAGRDASALAELTSLLARHDEAALAALLAEAQGELREQEAWRTERLDRRGRLAEQLERLRREAETDEAAVSLTELESELERLADRYAVWSICAELIRRTKAVFEEERQPEVLRRASRYFAAMTEEAYVRMAAPGDSASLLAETADRQWVDSAFLSRGTREQMFLALRFALAGATSPETALPLLLDDLFVHFDGARLRSAARVLGELSKERQIVLFTCHEHVADTIAASVPQANRVRMERKGAAAEASGLFPSASSSRG
ncbi:AAA family ATPase [Cohnella zeiphila]|uniref:AAA family ATPase n=1 Tax=Cohnella zeiphila TaxID=2761120 RepID=A0A7X0VTI9_9BACL|nr:AAA family ATPase [Cohnella zeiphila]MBB6729415.1 AAA family ATPase [Cohnella zeiphila]